MKPAANPAVRSGVLLSSTISLQGSSCGTSVRWSTGRAPCLGRPCERSGPDLAHPRRPGAQLRAARRSLARAAPRDSRLTCRRLPGADWSRGPSVRRSAGGRHAGPHRRPANDAATGSADPGSGVGGGAGGAAGAGRRPGRGRGRVYPAHPRAAATRIAGARTSRPVEGEIESSSNALPSRPFPVAETP